MRHPRRWFPWGGVLLAAVLAPSAAALVYETAAEFSAAADLDGDGLAEVVIVDRVTGVFRVGYQAPAGVYTWAPPHASGVGNVAGFSTGRLIATNRESLAFASPEANRVNVLDAPSAASAGVPVSIFPATVGPTLVTAVDIGGAGATAHDDLFLITSWNGGASSYLLEEVRSAGGGVFSLMGQMNAGQPIERGNRIRLRAGMTESLALLGRGTETVAAVFTFPAGAPVMIATTNGLPPAVEYSVGFFPQSATYPQFLFYEPGGSNLTCNPISEPSLNAFQFEPGTVYPMGQAIEQVQTLESPSDTRLLVIFQGGASATIYDYNGASAPTPVRTFAAPAGQSITGAAASGAGRLVLFTGNPSTGQSSNFQGWNRSGAGYVAGPSGALPGVHDRTAPANVLLFQSEPFVSTTPRLLGALNSGDWASGLLLSAATPPSVTVTNERYRGTALGLGSPQTAALGVSPSNTHFGVVNQYARDISVFSVTRPAGEQVAGVSIVPAPGHYPGAIQVRLIPEVPTDEVWFRVGTSGIWSSNAAALVLFQDTTVHYYAKPSGGVAKSAIHAANYTFAQSPSVADSDGDGVPDYVEIARGLDPLAGNDSDGDGYHDLDELTFGTDPGSAADKPPTNHVRLELKASFDLVRTLRSIDGPSTNVVLSAPGTVVRAYDLGGSLLQNGATAPLGLPGVADPAVRLASLVQESSRSLLVLATEPHYDIATAGADKRHGRELLGLVAMPDLPPPLVTPYVFGGGNITNEAAAWVIAASNAVKTVSRETFAGELGVFDTLTALLLERRLAQGFLVRGVGIGSNLTLFPFRPSDAGRSAATASALLGLESTTTNGWPAFRLQSVLSALSNGVAAAASGPVRDLRKLTTELYRISAASNNVPDGCTNCVIYPSPVDVLREFIGTGALESNYAGHINLTLPERVGASNGVAELLSGAEARPVISVVLKVRPDSFTGDCTVLQAASGSTLYSLFHSGGVPFGFPDAFRLAPETLVAVKAHSDIPAASCGGVALEVIDLKVIALPVASSGDANGNLLYDDWEALFGSDPSGDPDGDDFTNLQEMLDGTDPADGASHAGAVVDLAPPAIAMDLEGGGSLSLKWSWPAAFAGKVGFGVKFTDDVGTLFTDDPAVVTYLGGGQFQVDLANPGTSKRFYVVYMFLK